MPFYFKKITCPANTPSTNPTLTKMNIMGGVIHRVICIIPAGHAGLTGLGVFRGLTMIAPVGESDLFSGDDSPYDYAEYIELGPADSQLEIRTYNKDTHFEHAFLLGIAVLPPEAVPMQTINLELLKALADFIGYKRTE